MPGRAALGIAALLITAACAVTERPDAPLRQISFDTYRQDTVQLLQQRRAFQGADQVAEIEWNAPHEWRPAGQPHKGILLVHGLGDSPWSFHDIGQQLADQGFLVRTVLLPGHGTRPEDMLDVTLEDWRRVVAEQAQALSRDVDQVYLGGFSTGANLVLDYAYAHPDIQGLLLFSPAFMSNSSFDWLAPLVSWARPWLLAADNGRPMQTVVRYMNVPTNGFAQFYRSSRSVRLAMRGAPYGKPVLMVVAENDSVLDSSYLSNVFGTQFTHPASRLIWYGKDRDLFQQDQRVLVRSDYLPELQISQFSHMGVLFSPRNDLYGASGSLRMCWNGQAEAARTECEQGAPVWFSDWGYIEPGKIHARLTFNPYFDWQNQIMAQVLDESSEELALPRPSARTALD
ncbi:alpha/beta hydrolase [Bordetella genomosp. 4]|uniref:Alpha/beta hydrolase n=1 Tax=Bordetella genomosp. 4 TaxID=463044 RepID=A0A261TMD1_9BORD|nr:alpha/beta fold hydrolase [Bordetella genomosp. 4]OZI50818.1 alpha/beta hydrolase [Bordetella genomosp. 4]